MSNFKPRLFRYELPGNWTVLAGATDEDNDYLSTTLAEPADWWFHADGVPGSHVILRAKPDEEPGRETIEQAAAVAAFHSKARGAGAVRVHCARARNVTKPRGAKPGTVQVSKGRVLKVRPDVSHAVRLTGAGEQFTRQPDP
jgi:predicted ribosome quality control (RQC) complex YloA/Tae2 family protein